jgi:ketosteroid isomerase-like protein
MLSDLQVERLALQNEIEDLIARFDDAVIRNDRNAFRDLWTADAVWEISQPVPMRAVGPTAIVAALDSFHTLNKFFFRSTARPVIDLDQDWALFRSPTFELARREERIGYANVAMYYDKAKRENGQWRFVHRNYQYIWVDLKTPLAGESVPMLKLHGALR